MLKKLNTAQGMGTINGLLTCVGVIFMIFSGKILCLEFRNGFEFTYQDHHFGNHHLFHA